MQSNKGYTTFVKYFFLLMAIQIAGIGIGGYFYEATINGVDRKLDIYELCIFLAIAVLFLIFWIAIKDRIVRVRLGGQNITIDYGDETEAVNWHDVERISQYRFVVPPMYKLKIKNDDQTYLFITQPQHISFGFGVTDASSMGAFIERKKSELGI